MSLIVEEVGGVTMDGLAIASGSLTTYPSLEWRECYRAILPIFHPLPICESRSSLGAHPEFHVAFRASLRRDGAVIMSKVENMDPVWDDLDR